MKRDTGQKQRAIQSEQDARDKGNDTARDDKPQGVARQSGCEGRDNLDENRVAGEVMMPDI